MQPKSSPPTTGRLADVALGSATWQDHAAVDGDGPGFGQMIGLVAIVVATVILVFFGIGYFLGRIFL
ncbi:MAG: hypothetical protein AABM31_08650 [Actinomycetota bacterium]